MRHLATEASAETRNLHKANYFRASIAVSPRLLDDIIHEYQGNEETFEVASFNDMITKLKARYKPTQNQVLLHFQFHSLMQEPDETIDTFINKVKEEASQCNFTCNDGCNVIQTLSRDRIIMGTNNKNVREDALEKEYSLADLEKQARKIEATEAAAKQISKTSATTIKLVETITDASVSKISKGGGRYSLKAKQQRQYTQHLKTSLQIMYVVAVVTQNANEIPIAQQEGSGVMDVDTSNDVASSPKNWPSRHKTQGTVNTLGTQHSEVFSSDIQTNYDPSPRYSNQHGCESESSYRIYATSQDTTKTERTKHIEICINGTPTRVMIDSGAEVNILL